MLISSDTKKQVMKPVRRISKLLIAQKLMKSEQQKKKREILTSIMPRRLLIEKLGIKHKLKKLRSLRPVLPLPLLQQQHQKQEILDSHALKVLMERDQHVLLDNAVVDIRRLEHWQQQPILKKFVIHQLL